MHPNILDLAGSLPDPSLRILHIMYAAVTNPAAVTTMCSVAGRQDEICAAAQNTTIINAIRAMVHGGEM